MSNESVMIAGVGGQGILLVSKVIGSFCAHMGYDVKVSEVHGMSQRGGSVVTHVRYGGDKVYSPVIDLGEADLLLSFELLEAARYLPYLRADGTVITNTQRIMPMPVITGASEYPEGLENSISSAGVKLISFDALTPAEEAGNPKAVNMVLLGTAARLLGGDAEMWHRAVTDCAKPQFAESNIRAFDYGYSYAERSKNV